MGSVSKEILHDVPPYIRVYTDGTIHRLVGTDVIPPITTAGATSKDVIISPQTGVSARLFRPPLTTPTEKLPLIIYFHGGAFVIASPAEPKYHHSIATLVSHSRAVAVSVHYRLAPEHPLPTAFLDSLSALRWVGSHAPAGSGSEEWLKQNVDFNRVFLAGDSAGATIAHHLTIRVGSKLGQEPDQESGQDPGRVTGWTTGPDPEFGFKISGTILINPYFWGKEPIGSERTDHARKAMVDKWWEFVCPVSSGRGSDDPLINPFADGAPGLEMLGSGRVMVTVSEMDILRDRGWAYYEALVKSNWKGKVEMVEVEGEDHVFHIFDPNGEKAINLMKKLSEFINMELED